MTNLTKFIIVKYITKKLDSTIKVKYGKSLQCDTDNRTIYVNFKKQNDIDNQTFMELVKELNPNCNYNPLLLGILHEIGHCFTWLEDFEEDYNRDIELLSKLYQNELISDVDYNRLYVRLEGEQVATQWAVDFAEQNPTFMNKLDKIIREQ